MKKVIIITIIIFTYYQLIFSDGIIENENNNQRYAIYLGKGGHYIEIGLEEIDPIANKKINSFVIKSPGDDRDYFIELGATDYTDNLVFIFSESLFGNRYTLFSYNFKLRQKEKLKIYEKKRPYFICIIDKTKKLLINYEDHEKKILVTELYDVIKETNGNVLLKMISENENLQGIEDKYKYKEKFNIDEQKLYFTRDSENYAEFVALNILNNKTETLGRINKNKNDKIYFLSVKGDSVFYVNHTASKKRVFSVYDKKLENKKFERSFDYSNNDRSFTLDEAGSNVIWLNVDNKKNIYSIKKFNFNNKKEVTTRLTGEFKEYVKKNKYRSFIKNRQGKMQFGIYDIDENMIIKKRCPDCPK